MLLAMASALSLSIGIRIFPAAHGDYFMIPHRKESHDGTKLRICGGKRKMPTPCYSSAIEMILVSTPELSGRLSCGQFQRGCVVDVLRNPCALSTFLGLAMSRPRLYSVFARFRIAAGLK